MKLSSQKYKNHLERFKKWRLENIDSARILETVRKRSRKNANPDKILCLERKYQRTRAAAIHMQQCINALPELERLIAAMEGAHDQ